VPVIVQNAQQVNVATEGSQQTNVHKPSKRHKKVKQSRKPLRPAISLASRK
jgi:hypothetical protein